MQNKTKTYLLLAAVLGIWGTIAYQMLSEISSDDMPETIADFSSKFNPKPIALKDTFSIQPIERDPFLGTLAKKKVPQPQKKPTLIVPKVKPKFPMVIYNARIKKPESDETLFIVTINNQQYKLKKGQFANSIKLVKGNAAAIVIRYKNQTKTIKRQ